MEGPSECALSEAQLARFYRDGYLVVEDVVPGEAIERVRQGFTRRLDDVARRLRDEGRIKEVHQGLCFEDRYTRILSECPDFTRYLNISLPLENNGLPPDAEMFAGQSVFEFITNPFLLDLVESVIGPEIYSNPIQHVRIKPPVDRIPGSIKAYSNVGTTTWHQDLTAVMDDALETQFLTTWVAITDVAEDAGCLVVAPRSHETNGRRLVVHCPGDSLESEMYIPDAVRGSAEIVRLPIRAGGVILFHPAVFHASTPNVSGKVRWSFDLRWNPVGQPSGRPAFPGFVARSRSNPESVLQDGRAWARSWSDARDAIIEKRYKLPIYNSERWVGNEKLPIC